MHQLMTFIGTIRIKLSNNYCKLNSIRFTTLFISKLTFFPNRCVERCQEGTVRAQKFVQSELERFQEQLSRCVLQCQDEVKDKVTPSTSDADIDKYRLEFEQCAIACCDKNIGKLGPLTRRVKETLMSGKY